MADVYHQLKHLAERYTKLLSLFRTFHAEGGPLLKGGDIPGVLVSALTVEGTSFDISIAGTTARFVFSMTDSTDKGTRGVVRAYRLDPLRPGTVAAAAGSFEFNGVGDTGRKKANGDCLVVTEDDGACLLIAELMHKAITFPGS
jgi:hypothetical protein